MSHPTDVVAYTFNAEIYCPTCILSALPTGDGEAFDGWADCSTPPMSTEDNLTELAYAFQIDRENERSFDSGDFPKVVFRDHLDDNAVNVCGGCFMFLEEV